MNIGTSLDICRLEDAISVVKENGTEVSYFIFDEYEIHFNRIPPHSVQEWHFHEKIEEIILVISGKMKCSWMEKDKMKSEMIEKKEIVRVKHSVHTFSNESEDDCEFIVFRMVPDGVSKREIIKRDKVQVEVKEK